MNREELLKAMTMIVVQIQDISGRNVLSTINEKTVPIGGLEGFDSLNGLELSMMIPKEINWSGKNVCVSDDGKKALSIGEIVDRLLNFQNPSE